MSDCVHPCPCGHLGDPQKECRCVPAVVTRYQKRISGPLLDRIDIHIEVPRVDYQKLSSARLGESSETIRQRVQAARDIQRNRFANPDSRTSKVQTSNVICNSDMRVAEIRQFCKLDEAGESLVRAAMADELIRSRLSSRTQVSAHDCGLGGK
jgi:magnesium chelatase family protein